jgi:phosphoenolpyruvate mutase
MRVAALAERLRRPGLARILEVHSPLSAMIAERVHATVDGQERHYDGFWSSSLVDATLMGMTDTGVLSIDRRLSRAQDVLAVTALPMVFDADNGGAIEDFGMHVKRMEAIGISAVIVEDKRGPKRNSLVGANQHQDDAKHFGDKIAAARAATTSPDFMVIARIESLILGKSLQDALTRADIYADSGADGIMIHSRQTTADEVIAFARALRRRLPDLPLVVVPTAFPDVAEAELEDAGFDIVIYANHMLRAAYPAMEQAARGILSAGCGLPRDPALLPAKDLLGLVPGNLP